MLASEDGLLAGRVTQCFDRSALAKLTGRQQAVFAFQKKMDLSPEQEVIDCVDSLPATSSSVTVGKALAA